jgi:NADH dehydrogenase/NADH:ubiquinone oxidoreductase subunit G
MVTIRINQEQVITKKGTPLLKACLDSGHFVPNLCYLDKAERPAACCRLCFVEIEGADQPMASCCVDVQEGMSVMTDTPAVRQLQITALKLLLSVHDVDCKNCPANRKCALQDSAKYLKIGLNPKPFPVFLKETTIDDNHPCLDYYPNRCVLCGRCVEVCKRRDNRPELAFTKRGFDTVIGFYSQLFDPHLDCEKCRRCIKICPVGALTPKNAVLIDEA